VSGDVIEIATKFTDAAPIEVRRRGWDECGHKHTLIDDQLRTVSCVDCGEERLDPIEVLIHLAADWRQNHREAERLQELRADYARIEVAKWERARDRHLNAHPDHRAGFDIHRTSFQRGACRTCYHLEITAPRQYMPASVPAGG
jgi:hypothetical protein